MTESATSVSYTGTCLITSLPKDLYPNVFGKLAPIDLLRLEQTCKLFRDTLREESEIEETPGSLIWKTAARRLQIPIEPKDVRRQVLISQAVHQNLMERIAATMVNGKPLTLDERRAQLSSLIAQSDSKKINALLYLDSPAHPSQSLHFFFTPQAAWQTLPLLLPGTFKKILIENVAIEGRTTLLSIAVADETQAVAQKILKRKPYIEVIISEIPKLTVQQLKKIVPHLLITLTENQLKKIVPKLPHEVIIDVMRNRNDFSILKFLNKKKCDFFLNLFQLISLFNENEKSAYEKIKSKKAKEEDYILLKDFVLKCSKLLRTFYDSMEPVQGISPQKLEDELRKINNLAQKKVKEPKPPDWHVWEHFSFGKH